MVVVVPRTLYGDFGICGFGYGTRLTKRRQRHEMEARLGKQSTEKLLNEPLGGV